MYSVNSNDSPCIVAVCSIGVRYLEHPLMEVPLYKILKSVMHVESGTLHPPCSIYRASGSSKPVYRGVARGA